MRLIDADAIRYIDLNADMPNSNIHVWVTFLDWIKRMPTVEERKTGKWIASDDFDEWYWCSECRKGLTMFDGTYKYCPNCGAKMEGGKDE